MKNAIWKLALIVSFIGTTACSNINRSTSVEPSEDEVFTAYDELNQNSGGISTLMEDLREDTTSTVYYSKSGTFGSVYSVFSFGDMGFLTEAAGVDLHGVPMNSSTLAIADATVVFLDAVGSDGVRNFVLMLKLTPEGGGQPIYFSKSTTSYDFSKTNFEVGFDLGNGETLVLRSRDVSANYGDELAPTIQLKAYMQDSRGEYPVGQFSVLKGYGGIQ